MSGRCSSAVELVLRHAAAAPDRRALVYPRGRGYDALTYGDLERRVAAVAQGLRQRGIGAGDRVALLVPMSSELYVTMLAIASLGAIAVFVEPSSTLREAANALEQARPKAFVGIPKAHALRVTSRAVARIPLHVLVGSRASALAANALPLATVEADGRGASITHGAVDADAPALLTFSSGTTGKPKGALRTHGFLALQHEGFVRMFRRSDDLVDVDMSAFAIILLSSLCSGGTAVIPRMGKGVADVDGDQLLAAIDEHRVTALSGSPAFIQPILEAARARGRSLPTVRRILTGGAPVPPSFCELADERLVPNGSTIVVYGSTEAEPIATIEGDQVRGAITARMRAGDGLCVGHPDPEIRVRLLRPASGPLVVGPEGIAGLALDEPGRVGEVAVAGPHVNERYYRNKPAERATKLVDERGAIWHRTGDAAYFDDDGRLWLVGRIADIVHRRGRDYFPSSVEAVAQAVPGVARAALIADGQSGSLLVVQAARRFDRAALQTALAAADIEVDRIEVARRLPVDPRHQAKLDYKAIRRRFLRPAS